MERHLETAQARYRDFEDVVLNMEREKTAYDRQRETTRKQLETESMKRAQLEQLVKSQKAELTRLKDREVKRDRDFNKALTDLKAREWEVKQLESRQDKTIVEHVHVLEEAKRVTDRQLADAQEELQKNANYIRSLEKVKSRLVGEAEDLAREIERERVESRSKGKVSQRDSISRLRPDQDELQLRYDNEASAEWQKEKQRLELIIGDLNKAYETSTATQAEQQLQIVSLHSQVRELRSVLNEAETDRALLQKARRALQAELETLR